MKKGGFLVFIGLLAFLGLVFYQPLFSVLRRGLTEGGRWSLSPLATILTDSYFVHIIVFSLKQAALSTLLSLGIGLPGAYLLTRYSFPGKSAIRSLTVVPFVLPAVVVALGFILFFGESGWLNQWLMSVFHLPSPPLHILYSLTGIVLAHAFYNAPIVMRLVNASWEGIDPEIDEAAASLGAGGLRRFVGITIPLLTPALLSSAALVFIFSFLSFPIVLALGGARYATIEVGIYTLIRTLLDYKLGSALILVETALSLSLTYVYLKAEGGFATLTQGSRRVATYPLFSRKASMCKMVIAAYIIIAAVFFLGPISSVLVDSLRVRGQWSVESYRQIFTLGYNPFLGVSPLRTVLNSLFIGGISTAISLPVGILIAMFAVRGHLPGRRLLEAILMAPLAVSSVAIGFAVLYGLGGAPLHLSGTLIAIALAHAILTYPFVVRVIRPVLEGLDQSLVEAARSLGASPTRAFFEVILPLIGPGILVAAVFGFALSIGEMSATIMLMRPGLGTMPIAVYSLLSARQFGAASAMGMILVVVAGIAFVVIDRLGKRGVGCRTLW